MKKPTSSTFVVFVLSLFLLPHAFGQTVDNESGCLSWGLLTSPGEPGISVYFMAGNYNYIYNDECAWIRVRNNVNDEISVRIKVSVKSQCGTAQSYTFEGTLKGWETRTYKERFEDGSCKEFRKYNNPKHPTEKVWGQTKIFTVSKKPKQVTIRPC